MTITEPPAGWQEPATRGDVELLRADLRLEMRDLELRLERTLRDALRTSMYTNLGAMATLTAAVVAAIKL